MTCILFIILQGFPTAITLLGISFVTTLPAPIIVLSPILTPGKITTLPPIQTSLPIVICFPCMYPFLLSM